MQLEKGNLKKKKIDREWSRLQCTVHLIRMSCNLRRLRDSEIKLATIWRTSNSLIYLFFIWKLTIKFKVNGCPHRPSRSWSRHLTSYIQPGHIFKPHSSLLGFGFLLHNLVAGTYRAFYGPVSCFAVEDVTITCQLKK